MKFHFSAALDALIFGVMSIAVLTGIVYGWRHWRDQLSRPTLSAWRKTLSTLGLFAVTTQALLFTLWLVGIGAQQTGFKYWAFWVNPPFLLAVTGSLAGSGKARWWLFSASIQLFVISFFFVFSE